MYTKVFIKNENGTKRAFVGEHQLFFNHKTGLLIEIEKEGGEIVVSTFHVSNLRPGSKIVFFKSEEKQLSFEDVVKISKKEEKPPEIKKAFKPVQTDWVEQQEKVVKKVVKKRPSRKKKKTS